MVLTLYEVNSCLGATEAAVQVGWVLFCFCYYYYYVTWRVQWLRGGSFTVESTALFTVWLICWCGGNGRTGTVVKFAVEGNIDNDIDRMLLLIISQGL